MSLLNQTTKGFTVKEVTPTSHCLRKHYTGTCTVIKSSPIYLFYKANYYYCDHSCNNAAIDCKSATSEVEHVPNRLKLTRTECNVIKSCAYNTEKDGENCNIGKVVKGNSRLLAAPTCVRNSHKHTKCDYHTVPHNFKVANLKGNIANLSALNTKTGERNCNIF